MTTPRKLTQNFVETEIDSEVLIVDLDGGELFSLEGTARAIWRAIDGRSVDEIVAGLADEYESSGGLAADVELFLEQLADARLIAVNA